MFHVVWICGDASRGKHRLLAELLRQPELFHSSSGLRHHQEKEIPTLHITSKYFSVDLRFVVSTLTASAPVGPPENLCGIIDVVHSSDVPQESCASLTSHAPKFHLVMMNTVGMRPGSDALAQQELVWKEHCIAHGLELILMPHSVKRQPELLPKDIERRGLLGGNLEGASRVLQVLYNTMWTQSSPVCAPAYPRHPKVPTSSDDTLLCVASKAEKVLHSLQKGLPSSCAFGQVNLMDDSPEGSSWTIRLTTKYYTCLVTAVCRGMAIAHPPSNVRCLLCFPETFLTLEDAAKIFARTVVSLYKSQSCLFKELVAAVVIAEGKEALWDKEWVTVRQLMGLASKLPIEIIPLPSTDDGSLFDVEQGHLGFARVREVIECTEWRLTILCSNNLMDAPETSKATKKIESPKHAQEPLPEIAPEVTLGPTFLNRACFVGVGLSRQEVAAIVALVATKGEDTSLAVAAAQSNIDRVLTIPIDTKYYEASIISEILIADGSSSSFMHIYESIRRSHALIICVGEPTTQTEMKNFVRLAAECLNFVPSDKEHNVEGPSIESMQDEKIVCLIPFSPPKIFEGFHEALEDVGEEHLVEVIMGNAQQQIDRLREALENTIWPTIRRKKGQKGEVTKPLLAPPESLHSMSAQTVVDENGLLPNAHGCSLPPDFWYDSVLRRSTQRPTLANKKSTPNNNDDDQDPEEEELNFLIKRMKTLRDNGDSLPRSDRQKQAEALTKKLALTLGVEVGQDFFDENK